MRIVENLSGVVMFLNVSLLRTNLFIFEKKNQQQIKFRNVDLSKLVISTHYSFFNEFITTHIKEIEHIFFCLITFNNDHGLCFPPIHLEFVFSC